MDLMVYETAFSINADFLKKIEPHLQEIENHRINKSLFQIIEKINEEGMIKREEVFRFKNKNTGELIELSEMQSIPGFDFTDKVIKLSLLVCKRG